MRRTALAIAFALISLGAAAASGSGPPEREGRSDPERIVSINPSLTQMLLALGAGERLVGVDDFSAESEPTVADLPRVGGLYDSSVEAVAALRPDLVVLVPSVQQRSFREQLGGLGVRVLELDPVSFEEVLDAILQLGRATGLEAAARERVAAVRRARDEVERATADRRHPRTVLVLQREPLYVVGEGSFIDAMLRSAGAQNLGAELSGAYPRASLEWLIAAGPEVILDADADAEPPGEYWSRWASLPAVRDGRVRALPRGAATLPGPHLDRALRLLAEALHGPDGRP